jgi:hypothetical protein
MQLAEARCQRIAQDPPRDDYDRRTLVRPSAVRPAPAVEGYEVVDLGLAVRDVAGNLGAVLTAFERELGALQRQRLREAEDRRREAVEYGLRAAAGLRYVADKFQEVPLPAAFDATDVVRSDALPIEAQAYLFRSGATPSRVNRVLAAVSTGNGRSRMRLQQLPRNALELSHFFRSWDGRPEDR